MNSSDFESAVDALERGDFDAAIRTFNRFSAAEWGGELYEWKQENALRVSEFIQQIVRILPLNTEFDKVQALAENYVLALVDLPHSIDLAAEALVTFWNRNPSGDHEKLKGYLELLSQHPDAEHVVEITAQAIEIHS
ncbi:hypothetical protein GWO61_06380 [Corynebacterium macginleyi]|uniref:hypothetical protein n=1 Tax=Corynebacterium macginleyi TaxID=38290 RepID=UPI00190D5F0F|nr:hypothetical protein [Corynebacterium macginleyi]MBK4167908.1 hypothetical protein [Corynebacterium macginleyi]